MRRLLRPGMLALLVWCGWGAMIVLLYALHRFRVMHPHFLPLAICLVLQTAGGLALVAIGLRGLVRGPARLQTLAWLLLGTAPLWSAAALTTYGFWQADIRELRMRAVGLHAFAVPAGATLADAEARFRYPHRVEGRHLVMWTDRTEGADDDVAAMDEQIERLEKLLGRKCRSKAHWIRGSLLGYGGRYFQGLVLGSSPQDSPAEPGSLEALDKHEIAHFVIHHLCGPQADPPTLLIEGWAESQTGHEKGMPARRAWERKQAGAALDLQTLTSREWYDRHEGPVYKQGGPLVDYILRTYGGAKFFKLYSTCGRKTFAEDCRHILGVSLDELERAYWADIEQRVVRETPLLSVDLAEGINEERWKTIAKEQAQAMRQMRRRLRRARFTRTMRRHHDLPESGKTFIDLERNEVVQDGPRGRVVTSETETEGDEREFQNSVRVAAPECSFRLVRKNRAGRWSKTEACDYVRSRLRIARTVGRIVRSWDASTLLRGPAGGWPTRITGLQRIENDGRELWQVEFESTGERRGTTENGAGWFHLAPDQNWTLHAYELTKEREAKDPITFRGQFQYRSVDGDGIIPGQAHVEWIDESGEVFLYWSERITDVEFGPAPDEQFTPEAFGVARAELAESDAVPWRVWITVAGCSVSLLGGVLLLGGTCFHARRARQSAADSE